MNKSSLAHLNPAWLFILTITILATASMIGLAQTDINDGLVGFLGGAWVCVLVGFTFWIWKVKALQEGT